MSEHRRELDFKNCFVRRDPDEDRLVKDFTGEILFKSEVI